MVHLLGGCCATMKIWMGACCTAMQTLDVCCVGAGAMGLCWAGAGEQWKAMETTRILYDAWLLDNNGDDGVPVGWTKAMETIAVAHGCSTAMETTRVFDGCQAARRAVVMEQ